MAKKDSNSAVEKYDERPVQIIGEKAIIDSEQGKKLLSKLKDKKEVEITADYLEMEEGEVVRGVIVGFNEIPALPPREGVVQAVKLMIEGDDGEVKFVVTASTMLVTNLMSLPLMTPVCIKYLGMKSGKTYKYQNYGISVLVDEV